MPTRDDKPCMVTPAAETSKNCRRVSRLNTNLDIGVNRVMLKVVILHLGLVVAPSRVGTDGIEGDLRMRASRTQEAGHATLLRVNLSTASVGLRGVCCRVEGQ